MNFNEFSEIIKIQNLKPCGSNYLSKTLRDIAKFWGNSVFSVRHECVSKISPRVRIIITIVFLLCISFSRSFPVLLLFAFLVFCFVFSSIIKKIFTIRDFLGSGFLIAFVFTLLMLMPATINLFSFFNSQVILTFVKLHHDYQIGFIHIPAVIGITKAGLMSFGMVLLRVMSSVSIVLCMILSMRWFDLVLGLRQIGLPAIVAQLFSMTLIFLHVLLKRSEEVHIAKVSRMICKEKTISGQKWVGVRIARAWNESLRLMDDVHNAMKARGFGI